MIDSNGGGSAISIGPSSILYFDHRPDSQKSEGDVKGPNEDDLGQLWGWNEGVPTLVERCVHAMIADVAYNQPEAIAIESWNSILTYKELDDSASQLARHLRFWGGEIETRICLCFEKPKWAVVALLGIMKAGAPFSLTDPSQPEARLRTIVEQTGAELAITSVAQSLLAPKIAGGAQVIAVSGDFFDEVPDLADEALHRAPASGGRVCVPSDEAKMNDLNKAMRPMNAFEVTLKNCAVLRTRIFQVSGRYLVQVAIKGKLEWYSGTDLKEYLVRDRDEAMDLGRPHFRYAAILDAEASTTSFVLSIHHALYDGWAMPLIVAHVHKAYIGVTLSRPAERKHFIKDL
ncbi:hypothetical protein FZEAL_8452 [Fusarium zealandicum]|uniref:AMP-dependent synthetase/ligase domain-containing protein n=1 Tax=Fusarium zealandicum TaxID=1053134 RepID=A0A8H4XHU2_9HYPO|nr:hypothetical protein FZEAL_8452 [Fusarium zealandicum]